MGLQQAVKPEPKKVVEEEPKVEVRLKP